MPRDRKRKLGQDLVAKGLLSEGELAEGLMRHRATGERLGEALVGLAHLSRRELWNVLGAPWIELSTAELSPACVDRLPRSTLRRCQVVPVEVAPDGTLIVAMVDPLNMVYVDEVWRESRMPVEVCAADPADVMHCLAEIEARRADTQRPGGAPTARRAPIGHRTTESYSDERPAAGECVACGRFAAEGQGTCLAAGDLPKAWQLAAKMAEEHSTSRHALMAEWQRRADGLLRICEECLPHVADAANNLCAMCNRPTHTGSGGVVAAAGSDALARASEEMGLRRRVCPSCRRTYCLSCGARHGRALGSDKALCPLCGTPGDT